MAFSSVTSHTVLIHEPALGSFARQGQARGSVDHPVQFVKIFRLPFSAASTAALAQATRMPRQCSSDSVLTCIPVSGILSKGMDGRVQAEARAQVDRRTAKVKDAIVVVGESCVNVELSSDL